MALQTAQSSDSPASFDLGASRLAPAVLCRFNGSLLSPSQAAEYLSISAAKTSWSRAGATGSLSATRSRLAVVPCSALSAEKKAALDFVTSSHPLHALVDAAGVCLDLGEALAVSLDEAKGLRETVSIEFKPCTLASSCKPASDLRLLTVQLVTPAVALHEAAAADFLAFKPRPDAVFRIDPGLALHLTADLWRNQVRDYSSLLPFRHASVSFVDLRDPNSQLATRPTAAVSCLPDDLHTQACEPYLTFTLNPTASSVTYHRRHKSLAETLGEIGGFNAVLFMLFLFVYKRYNQHVRDSLLLSRVFGFISEISFLEEEPDAQSQPALRRSKTTALTRLKTFRPSAPCCRRKKSRSEEESLRKLGKLRSAALDSVENTLDVVSLARDLNSLRLLCGLLFKQRHAALAGIASVDCRDPAREFSIDRENLQDSLMLEEPLSALTPATALPRHMKSGLAASRQSVRSAGQPPPRAEPSVFPRLASAGRTEPSELAGLLRAKDAYEELDSIFKGSREAGTDSLEHQLDLFFYKCMKETDEYIHKKMEEAERLKESSSQKIKPKQNQTDAQALNNIIVQNDSNMSLHLDSCAPNNELAAPSTVTQQTKSGWWMPIFTRSSTTRAPGRRRCARRRRRR